MADLANKPSFGDGAASHLRSQSGHRASGLTMLLLACCIVCAGQETPPQPAKSAAADAVQSTQLDRVVAVVNNQVILQSDLEIEIRIFRLLPISEPGDAAPVKALERLTTRALIVQQITQEDPQGLEVSTKELEDSLAELRQNLPACKSRECATPAGWSDYLATLGLAPDPVADYWKNRIAVLRFIEQRFRSGIRIAPEEIQKYYKESVAPKYAKPEDVPPLERVSARIQEILLQAQVNALFDEWLKSLQSQGRVEILDPALAPDPVAASSEAATNAPTQPLAGTGGKL